MNEAEISRYISETFEGVDVVVASSNSFFFYNLDRNLPPDHRFPSVTSVTSDIYDQFSNLNRPSVFRLNIGKQTFRSIFGEPSLLSGRDSAAESGENSSDYDFTALDQLMPHPVYSRMFWVCVLNPSDETFETKVRQLLAEAHDQAVSKYKMLGGRRALGEVLDGCILSNSAGQEASPWPAEGDRNGPQNRVDVQTQSKKEVPFGVFSSRAKMRAKFDRFSWDTLKREFVVAKYERVLQ